MRSEDARAIAVRMGLSFESRATGYGTLETALTSAVTRDDCARVCAGAPQKTAEAMPWPR
jgi:hypothetical protein